MTPTAGTRLGPYEILSRIGEGGMGQVFKARDTRLERIVAIKILPETLAGDPQFRERFEREARAIAGLSHTNICTLHDVGREAGIDFLVLEHLDGETLQQRLQRDALALDDALRFAIQIAGALDRAHRAGIVHRDLKPGNIFLARSSGETTAKLLDFGLAKASVPALAGAQHSLLPTTPPGTVQGTIIGTFQYMAPEQLEGEEADTRTDIFAFGAVLYEMLTGQKVFEAKSHAGLIAAILEHEPPSISTVQPLMPAALDRVVRKCLAKDRDRRWQTAADLKDELTWLAEAMKTPEAGVTATPKVESRARAVAAIAISLAALLAAMLVWTLTRSQPAASAPITQFSVPKTAGSLSLGSLSLTEESVALSPDGRRLVFHMRGQDGVPRLYSQRFDEFAPTPIRGTDRALSPTLSPDGEWVAFVESRQLKKVSLAGGPAIVVGDLPEGVLGSSWGPDDTIVLGGPKGLFRIPAAGGRSERLTEIDVDKKEVGHFWPDVTPDGRRVVFMSSTGAPASYQIEMLALDTRTRHTLAQGESPMVTSTGHLVFTRTRTLWAAPLDMTAGRLISAPVLVVEDVLTNLDGFASYDIAENGTFAYTKGGLGESNFRLSWINREGRIEPAVQERLTGIYHPAPRLFGSAEAVRLAITEHPEGGQDGIVVYDLTRGTRTPLSFPGNANSRFPLWTLDGTRLTFASQAGGNWDIYLTGARGGTMEPLVVGPGDQYPSAWSPSDGALVYLQTVTSQSDLWIKPRNRQPSPLIATSAAELTAVFSPDGRWLAYVSDESGRLDVYVQPYPGPGEKLRVSKNGGTEPIWSPRGDELFVRQDDGVLTSIAVHVQSPVVASQPATLRLGNPVVVSTATIYSEAINQNYDVAPDGRRFLIIENLSSAVRPVVVVQNWFQDLEKKVPKR